MRRAHSSVLKNEKEEEEGAQSTLTHFVQSKRKYDSKNPKQILVTETLVDFIADDLIPLSVVESTSFQRFVKSLDSQYQLPSRKHLSTTLLTKKYDSVKCSVLQEMKEAKSINLTVDLWSNRQMKSFLGITAHYFRDDWMLKSAMLGCNRVTGRHTSDNIILWFEQIVFDDFGIANEIKHVVTDSASNMKKAFALPGFVDKEGDESDSADDETDDSSSENGDFQPLDDFDETASLSFDHHSCFAHTIQLVIKDGMEKAGQIAPVLKKCSRLVGFVRRSTIAADLLKNEKRVQADNVTRWNSQLKMIRSVLSISEKTLSEVEGGPKLTLHDRSLLKDFVEILTPFEEATDTVQVSRIPSAGYVLPCIRGLHHHMHSVSSRYNSALGLSLKQSLVKRMLSFEKTDSYVIAAALDPRFKLRWCKNQDEQKKVIDLLKDSVKTVSSTLAPCPLEDMTQEPPQKKAKPAKTLFSFMPESGPSPSGHYSGTVEVDEYIDSTAVSMDINPAEFWKENKMKFQLLSVLAKEVPSIPSSSAPVERLFSIAGKIFTPERCRLTDKRFEQLMFIRCNNE